MNAQPQANSKAQMKTFFHKETFSLTHIISDGPGTDAVIIDSVLDFDPVTGGITTTAADEVLGYVKEKDLKVTHVLDTHVHADHLTAAKYLKSNLGVPYGLGVHLPDVQKEWAARYNISFDEVVRAADVDLLLADGDTIDLNGRPIGVLETPGHTPACITYTYDDMAFVGDTFFMPDYGTARCDFPDGDAAQLFGSLEKIVALGDATRLFMCHDYMPGGRELRWEVTVAEQKATNIHFSKSPDAQAFKAFREDRDKDLDAPRLLLPSLQVNICGGALPTPEDNGMRYIKIPLTGGWD